MQRILKFRVWLKKAKKMIYSDELECIYDDGGCEQHYALCLLATLKENFYNNSPHYPEKYTNLSGNKIIQQFTGLQDAEGKDIFEGDIVSVIDDNNIFEVKFGKVRRNIVGFDTDTIYPVELNTFYFEQEGRPYFNITENYLGKHDIEDTLVLGNIFENPDLLK